METGDGSGWVQLKTYKKEQEGPSGDPAMDEEDLYDEFGNYIGPELDDSDESEEENVEVRVHDTQVPSRPPTFPCGGTCSYRHRSCCTVRVN